MLSDGPKCSKRSSTHRDCVKKPYVRSVESLDKVIHALSGALHGSIELAKKFVPTWLTYRSLIHMSRGLLLIGFVSGNMLQL